MTVIALHRGAPENVNLNVIDVEVPLLAVLRPAMEEVLGRDLADAKLMLWLSPEPADPKLNGRPELYNLVPDYGFAVVEVWEAGVLVYRHPHTIREVVAAPLQALMHHLFPDDVAWGYRIGFKNSELYISRPAPEVEGVFNIPSHGAPATFSFNVRPLADPEPPLVRLSDLKVPDIGAGAPVLVLVDRSVYDDFDRRMLSRHVEEGGFLTGSVYRDAENGGRFVVRVSDAPGAHRTGASLLCFTFTGNSFRAMKQTIGERQLLGWWHTHLFQATETFGLSTIDVDLHQRTFRKPWQVAGLVNIDPATTKRTLRFYVRQGKLLVECPLWVIDPFITPEIVP